LELDLTRCNFPDLAMLGYETGIVDAFIASASFYDDALGLVADNVCQLKDRDMYEPALLEAYTGTDFRLHRWSTPALQLLFDLADREKLLASGDPLPDGDRFTIYRGVAGMGRTRRVRGFSWTPNYDRAAWFATRHIRLADPAVYRATIQRNDVLAYRSDRDEQEFLCRPDYVKRVKSNAA
jgi:hypothetical protein